MLEQLDAARETGKINKNEEAGRGDSEVSDEV